MPLRSRRCWRSRLSAAFLIGCVLFAASATKAEAEYTFTLIADSTGVFSDFFFPPSLNPTGTAAFFAALDNGSSGVFKGSGGNTTTIGINTGPLSTTFPTINQAGMVAFSEFDWNGGSPRIVAGNGGPLVTIANTAGPLSGFAGGYSTAINGAGTAAFFATQDSGPSGIFSGNGGAVTPILINSASLGAGNFSMNDAGTLAFRSGNSRIVTFNAGLVTTIADNSGALNFFGSTPSISNAGTVAFAAGVGGIDGDVFGIYKGNGGALTTIADLSGPFNYLGDFNYYLPSINAFGMVAFSAGLDAGGGGVFVGDGTVTSKVIGVGDSLFGSSVTGAGVSPISLNDAGQVAFLYQLANGTRGIAIANPVPEPGSAALLFGGLLAVLGLRRRCAQ